MLKEHRRHQHGAIGAAFAWANDARRIRRRNHRRPFPAGQRRPARDRDHAGERHGSAAHPPARSGRPRHSHLAMARCPSRGPSLRGRQPPHHRGHLEGRSRQRLFPPLSTSHPRRAGRSPRPSPCLTARTSRCTRFRHITTLRRRAPRSSRSREHSDPARLG